MIKLNSITNLKQRFISDSECLLPSSLPLNPALGAFPEVVFIYVLRTERYFRMTKYIDPKLSQEILETYQGYSLQVFTSGRIKLSFHKSHKDRVEYYAECPRRFKEAYAKQQQRSAKEYPEHFDLVDSLLANCPHSLIHRLHKKADNNATADNAHIITDTEADSCHVLLGHMHHCWILPTAALKHLMIRSGP